MTDLDELRAELDDFAQPQKEEQRPSREGRIIAGFEEIQRFVEQNGRVPQHGEDKDIFERMYAARLDSLRKQEECRSLLLPFDHQGLLAADKLSGVDSLESMTDDDLMNELSGAAGSSDITELRHVRTHAEKRAAEEIANREVCEDFDQFEPLFDLVKDEMRSGVRQSRSFRTQAKEMDFVQQGAFFIIGGQIAYIAEVGEEFTTEYERRDSRLRVIYDNRTESNVLLRSFQRALHRDSSARLIVGADFGPLFSDIWDENDIESGTIYVLRSLSSDPFIVERKELVHKIGVTGGKVETRIANAENEATYLLAKVEVVATYKLAGVNRTLLERLFHKLFASARLNVTINDRFGHPVQPEEWFLVPLFVIDEAVARIKDGSITGYIYDPHAAKLVKV